MTRTELLGFLREHWLGTQASVSPSGDPQAAVVGFVVSDAFETFQTTKDTKITKHDLCDLCDLVVDRLCG